MVILRTLILILIVTSTWFNPLLARDLEEFPSDCDETMDCFNPLPPSPNALKMKYAVQQSPLKFKRPENWNIRLFYLGQKDIYEFDKQGNVLVAKNAPATGYMVEMYSQAFNKPLWEGNDQIYYWYQPDKDLDENFNSRDLLTIPDLQIILANNRACYSMQIAEEYSFYVQKGKEKYLDGNCIKTVKVKIDKGDFITYPDIISLVEEGKASSYTHYWQVQYFDDPVTPVYNEQGNCVYYCDTESNKENKR